MIQLAILFGVLIGFIIGMYFGFRVSHWRALHLISEVFEGLMAEAKRHDERT